MLYSPRFETWSVSKRELNICKVCWALSIEREDGEARKLVSVHSEMRRFGGDLRRSWKGFHF